MFSKIYIFFQRKKCTFFKKFSINPKREHFPPNSKRLVLPLYQSPKKTSQEKYRLIPLMSLDVKILKRIAK